MNGGLKSFSDVSKPSGIGSIVCKGDSGPSFDGSFNHLFFRGPSGSGAVLFKAGGGNNNEINSCAVEGEEQDAAELSYLFVKSCTS